MGDSFSLTGEFSVGDSGMQSESTMVTSWPSIRSKSTSTISSTGLHLQGKSHVSFYHGSIHLISNSYSRFGTLRADASNLKMTSSFFVSRLERLADLRMCRSRRVSPCSLSPVRGQGEFANVNIAVIHKWIREGWRSLSRFLYRAKPRILGYGWRIIAFPSLIKIFASKVKYLRFLHDIAKKLVS